MIVNSLSELKNFNFDLGNNLLMIAPNNHLPFRRTGFIDTSDICRLRVKTESESNGKDEEEDRENRNNSENGKD